MPKKLEDCVNKVQNQGHDESSSYAICVSSTGLSPKSKEASLEMPTPDIVKGPHEDKISGGLADKKNPKDFDSEQLVNGQKVEMEHTKDESLAQEIAMDHLTEDKDYYRKLKTIEKSSGEGSRGGRVVGHTKNGHPIYAGGVNNPVHHSTHEIDGKKYEVHTHKKKKDSYVTTISGESGKHVLHSDYKEGKNKTTHDAPYGENVHSDHHKKIREAVKEITDIHSGHIQKSDFSNAAFVPLRGASSVDMADHILASQDENAKPMLEYLQKQLKAHSYGLTEKFDTFELPISTERGEFVFAGFCKEPGFFSGAVRRLNGETEQEFENDTLEILASVLTMRIGKLISKPDSILIPIKKEMESQEIKEEVKNILNINNVDGLLNMPDHELTEKLMTNQKPKVEIKVNENNEVTITLFKSLKESEMKFTDELLKAFGQPDNSGKKPAEKKPAKPADENDDVLSEVQDEDADQNPAINSDKKPQDDLDSSDDEVNQMNMQGNSSSPNPNNSRPAPMGGDDENTLPGSNFGGNTGGRQAQLMQGNNQSLDQDDMSAGMPMDNHEYIKMTTHAAGKQFWYRDPMTGQIIEKPNAPIGHADFDHSAVLEELISKVEGLSAQLNQLMGGDMLDQEGMGDDGQMPGDNSMDGEDPGLEQEEELLGQDLDGDGEQGEDPEHQQKVMNGSQPMAPQGGNQVPNPNGGTPQKVANKPAPPGVPDKGSTSQAKPSGGNPSAPGAKAPPSTPGSKQAKDNTNQPKEDKPDFDKMKKSLAAKYPHLSDEKLTEVLNKAIPSADLASRTKVEAKDTLSGESGDKLGSVQGNIGDTGGSTGDSDEGNTEKKKTLTKKASEISEESENSGEQGGEPANKQGNAFEKVKKSKFDRMWKIFNIEMPETLEKSEDVVKANEGLKKLQKCILKQGKTEADANKIVNRAVIAKYDLLGKGLKNFQNSNEFIGNVNNNRTEESSLSLEEMQKSRKADSDARFGIKEYVEQNEYLVVEKSSSINEQIAKEMKGETPDWSQFKTFQGEKLEKSTPDAFTKARQEEQDARWSAPEWVEGKVPFKKSVVAKSTSINERIKQDELAKSQNVTFKGKYKEYDESIVKSQKTEPTDSEKMQEAIIKKNWRE